MKCFRMKDVREISIYLGIHSVQRQKCHGEIYIHTEMSAMNINERTEQSLTYDFKVPHC